MSNLTVAIVAPGDMGHAVGRALKEHGHTPITCLAGRSERSRRLAEAGGVRDVDDMKTLVAEADIILSILPPASALDLARETALAMTAMESFPPYVDCNAISPSTAKAVGNEIAAVGAPFIDAGIIGLAPGKATPRFYVSGADTTPMEALDGCGFSVVPSGDEPGQASAIKMCYAALTKGTWTLHTALLMAAKSLGVYEPLKAEFEHSQIADLGRMEARVPFIPADSGRWIGEMEEIAATFREAGVTGGFHDGAAEVFRVLSRTPFADETRESMDRSRGLDEAIAVYVQHLEIGEG
ncbi:MAG: NAD(P)-dependent oxidoreductase [Rhodospirillaceae bacterium]|nr:NAD(P)-dependent oxidoreductase [Rhodospirillaceae bacterium]